LPPGDADFSTRWRLIKTGSPNIARMTPAHTRCSALKKGEQAVWQHRYWEHQIRDEADFARHVDYIHYNPVKHGLARSPRLALLQLRPLCEAGVYASDWGAIRCV
jgi:putative transposase